MQIDLALLQNLRYDLALFRRVFVVGLVAAFLALVLAALGGLGKVLAGFYLVLAVAHVGALAYAGWRLPAGERAAAPGWLYTAGFLHTLIALAVTLATAGALFRQNLGEPLAVLGALLAPMAAAVLPHAVGVFFGQLLEGPRAEEQAADAVARQMEEGHRSLAALFAAREAQVRLEMESLQRQAELWAESEAALRALVARVNGLTAGIAAADEAVRRLREGIDEGAEHSRELGPALEETVKVVGDLGKLQESVADLLSRPLFQAR